jgi:hypothetical protein
MDPFFDGDDPVELRFGKCGGQSDDKKLNRILIQKTAPAPPTSTAQP